jgi:hypothetical protein
MLRRNGYQSHSGLRSQTAKYLDGIGQVASFKYFAKAVNLLLNYQRKVQKNIFY